MRLFYLSPEYLLVMKHFFLGCLVLLCSLVATGQNFQLSEQAQLSVITCGPDQNELYAAFGHSAIRVYDPIHGIDDAFNYGIFDFDQPNFYLNFAKGFLYYKLGVYSYPHFRDAYIAHDRYIHEQALNLTQAQKQKIFDYLVWNAAPENQSYRYDYFYNNCATKVRDVFADVLKDEISFDGSFIETTYTIRELTDLYLKPLPWGDLGIDICLGLPMDKVATPYEYMFLPDYIESSFNHATINADGEKKNLVSEVISVYESTPRKSAFNLFHPFIIFGIILGIVVTITWRDWKNKKASNWIDVLIFLILGLVGVLLLALWTLTDHQAAAKNFNLLWAIPTHIIVPFMIFKKKEWLKGYFKTTTVITILVLVGWFMLPQQLNTSLLPLILVIAVRSVWRSVHTPLAN